jgi:hypothetical protein
MSYLLFVFNTYLEPAPFTHSGWQLRPLTRMNPASISFPHSGQNWRRSAFILSNAESPS